MGDDEDDRAGKNSRGIISQQNNPLSSQFLVSLSNTDMKNSKGTPLPATRL